MVPHVVVAGAACRDIARDDPRGWRLGGGATYSTLALARLGLRTAAVLGVDAEAAAATEIDMLRMAGADIAETILAPGPMFENVERPGGRVQYSVEVSEALPTSAVPDAWRSAPAWLLAPVAGEIGDDWASVPPIDAIVAVAWQGMLRTLVPGTQVGRRPPRPTPVIERADLVGVSHNDFEAETPIEELLAMLRPGAWLLVTKGASGGILWRRTTDGRTVARRYPAIPPERVVDPVGAGDTFLAALLAAWLTPDLARLRSRGADLRLASAAASLVVEGPGLTAVPQLSAVVARARSSLRGPTAD